MYYSISCNSHEIVHIKRLHDRIYVFIYLFTLKKLHVNIE